MTTTEQPRTPRLAALSRVREFTVPAAKIAGVAFGVMLLATLGLRLARAGVLPGVEVAGNDLSGLSAARVHDLMVDLARERAAHTVTALREPVPEAGAREQASVQATGEELGYSLDVDATVDRIMRRGRQLNPFAAFADQLRAFGGTLRVQPVQRLDARRFRRWVERAADRLRVDPVEGALAFQGTTIARVEPRAGAAVDQEALRDDVRRALFSGRTTPVRATTRPLPPRTTAADLARVEQDARLALSGPVHLRREDVTLTLSPEDLGAVLATEPVITGEDAELKLVVDPGRLQARIPAEVLARIEREPRDATFAIRGDAVDVVASAQGFDFDPEAAASRIIRLALSSGDRSGELEGTVTEPALSTEQARALGITEQVSTFTTHHPCCQSRVRNIHRMAELVDGVVIRPGETFSLNGHVGERTVAKGFAPGGAIYDGEFVEQIGGGVSQFTTTMFNAAFFGGYAIPEHKPHSYYISRYPVGREATLNWPNVDLKIHNNSPHGILVKTGVSGTSITVTFYGTTWVEVSDATGERRNVKAPPTRYKENPELPPGTEKVVTEGREGFDITVTRILRFPGGREERERFFTRYLPEPRVVERNSASPSPSPSPGEGTPSPSGSPSPTASPTA